VIEAGPKAGAEGVKIKRGHSNYFLITHPVGERGELALNVKVIEF
jgi:hypothetical protein